MNILKSLLCFVEEKGSGEVLGLFRILVGLQSLMLSLSFIVHFNIFFSDTGLLNSTFDNISHSQLPSLLNGVNSPTTIYLFLWMLALSSFSLMVGFYSRAFVVACWVGMLSLHHRCSLVMCGADVMVLIYLVYLSFSQCGLRYSVDAWIKGRQKLSGSPTNTVSLLPQRLIAIHLVIMYFTSALYKLFDSCWTTGNAVYYALHYKDFIHFPLPRWFVSPPATTIFTYMALATEISLGLIFIFPRYRNAILLFGVGLHTFIGYAINVPEFSFAVITGYCCFFSDNEIKLYVAKCNKFFSSYFVRIRP